MRGRRPGKKWSEDILFQPWSPEMKIYRSGREMGFTSSSLRVRYDEREWHYESELGGFMELTGEEA